MEISVMAGVFAFGALSSGAAIPQPMVGAPLPSSITLNSSVAGRKIEFSTNGGIEYFTPQYDQVSTTMLVVASNAPITHVRFTGQANDTWSIV